MEQSPLKSAMDACKKAFGVVAVVSLGINLLMLTSGIYMMQVYDRVLTSRNVDTLILLSIIVITALAVLAALDGLRTQIMVRVAGWFESRLANPVLSGGIAAGLKGGGGNAQGLRDLSALRVYIGSPSVFPLFDAPFAPIFLIAIFLIHPVLGWIAVIGAIVLFSIGVVNDRMTRIAARQASGAGNQALNFADAVVRNADVVTAMGIAPGVQKKLSELNAYAFSMQRFATDRSGVWGSAAKGIRLVLQSAILGFGAWLVILQEMTPGVMIAASILMGRALAPVEQSIGAWRAFTQAKASYERLEAVLEQQPPAAPATELPPPTGRLAVESVIYTPPKSDSALIKGASFELAPGEAMALIGPSAAGKSTLARLIVGTLLPTRGAVRLDGADMARWDEVDKGRYVGYLPQEIELLDGTIRENIARFTEAEDEEVIEAAQIAGVHELILKLPEGDETRIGADGIKLSGGQRQRIGLARAIFRHPKLVVLDEPNSNLDAVGEQSLLQLLQHLKNAGTTTIVIAHRPRLLQQMDKALILKEGSVQKFGPRDEVLASVTQGAGSNVTPIQRQGGIVDLGKSKPA